jgi:hypothetical protein
MFTFFFWTGVRVQQTVQVFWWIIHLTPAIEYPVPMEQQLPVVPMGIITVLTWVKPITLSGHVCTEVSVRYYTTATSE